MKPKYLRKWKGLMKEHYNYIMVTIKNSKASYKASYYITQIEPIIHV